MPPFDPSRYQLYQQLLRVREILAKVAAALERRSAAERDPEHRAALRELAQGIRRRLHEMWSQDSGSDD